MPAHIIEIPNLLKPNDGRVIHEIEPGITIEQWLIANIQNYRVMQQPPITVIFNGEAGA